jgi:Na+-transporting methylmalonyl-CoA/oxaloacetate decarboxylase gamma subunit
MTIWKLLALALLASLGFAMSASAKSTWTKPVNRPTTSTTTAAPVTATPVTAAPVTAAPATTTAAATPVSTTDVTTALDPAATTTDVAIATPPPPVGSAQIIAPSDGKIYTRATTVIFTGQVKTSDGPVYCTVQWGDQAVTGPVKATQVSADTYQCSATHIYGRTGAYNITFTATSCAAGTVIGADTHRVTVPF